MHRIVAAALAGLGLTAALAAPVGAQDIVGQQLAEMRNQASKDGFGSVTNALPSDKIVGILSPGQVLLLELNLQPGRGHLIMGACDENCSDLDMEILSPTGDTLDSDMEADDIPMVGFVSESGGPHALLVVMSDCGSESCYFGFTVTAK